MLFVNNAVIKHAPNAETYRYTLTVNPGEIIGIAAPSGAGKSTLLDIIAGFAPMTCGEIYLGDTIISNITAEKRPVSFLFQSDNVFAHLKVIENLKLGLDPEISKDTEKLLSTLKKFGLEGFENRGTATLSGGQRQRLALARTLLRDKPILLLDEPFTGLDNETASPLRALIKELVTTHKWRAILVSHSSDDLSSLADRVFTIKDHTLSPNTQIL